MRIVTWNIAWFDSLFDNEGRVRRDEGPGGLAGIGAATQARAVAQVLAALDADAVMVIEAPDTRPAPPFAPQPPARETCAMLRRFAKAHHLRARHAIRGFLNGTQQEIAVLFDARALRVAHDPQGPRRPAAPAPRFDGSYHPDPSVLPPEIGTPAEVRFSKPPLELAVTTAKGTRLRLIGVHIKSKAPHGATSPEDAIRRSGRNGRLQLAQALWLRARIDDVLDRRQPLIVLGDLNDGPGRDVHEAALGLSTVEVVLGEGQAPARRLYDPHARAVLDGALPLPVSARFNRPDLVDDPSGLFPVLLDYIMVSPGLMARNPRWTLFDPETVADPALAAALRRASDHYPVALDIDL